MRWRFRPGAAPATDPLPTIRRELLFSFTALVFLGLALLSVATGGLIELGLESSTHRILNTSLEVAEGVYAEEVAKLAAGLESLVGSVPVVPGQAPRMNSPQVDALLLYTAQGEWLPPAGLASHQPAGTSLQKPPAVLADLARQAAATGQTIYSSELVSRRWMKALAPEWAAALPAQEAMKNPDTAGTDPAMPVLVQVVVRPGVLPLPVKQSAEAEGQLYSGPRMVAVALRAVESNPDLARTFSKRLPDSCLSISVAGVRVLSTIRTSGGVVEPGSQQHPDLVATVQANHRYYGRVRFNTGERHVVVAGPIHSYRGEVVGALAVGLPPAGFEPTRKSAFAALGVAFVFSFGFSALLVNHLSHRLSAPLVWLRSMAQQITHSSGNGIPPRLLEQFSGANQIARTQEVQSLITAFSEMAESLEQKNRETQAYLAQLETEHRRLQWTTEQLNQVNRELEYKVTERTRELQTAVTQLREANQQKSRFLANVSHELRTPLNSIIGFSEMLRDELFGPLNSKQAEYVHIILSSANHLLQIIADILDLSRIEQGKIDLNLQVASVADLVESVMAVLKHQATAAQLHLSVEVAHDLPAIRMDPTRIKQVLYNLLSNAIKFTPAGGRIAVRARAASGWMTVEVEDTGIGIPEQDRERVFQEFAQVEEGYRRRFEGVGLGLPLSRRLVELHGGFMELESTVGKGTRVTFCLPLAVGGGASDADPGGR